ncbi:uncharacterized protein J3D65DRAFT_602122 [Phyllosticta citribraziliensis]|uniref:AAA+ ATPase domain-containing protein n=1 Tax=Phyllosticta citribraziliensis TaxID=989973 RepID=A0ABR1LVH5_9PEZI
MRPTTKEKLPSFLQRGKKHRVRKGLSEALGVLGIRGEGEEDAANPSIVFHPSGKDHGHAHSTQPNESDMSILSSLKRSQTPGSSSQTPVTSKSTSKPIEAPRSRLSLPRPAAKPEADRMSVNSIPATIVSDTTIAQEDNNLGLLKKAKSVINRAKSPSPPRREMIGDVHDSLTSLRQRLEDELKSSKEEWLAAGITIEAFISFISHERLRRMPPKGSRWDKILKWAEYFATSVSLFGERVEAFVDSSKEAAEVIIGCLQVLLQLGPQNGEALERAFSIFHEYGLAFAFYIRNYHILRSVPEARRELSLALSDMLALTIEITVYYRKSARTMSTSSVTVDFNITFGRLMESFIQHKDKMANLMWTYQLRNSSELTDIRVSIETIRQWLLPQDRTLQAVVTGRRATRVLRAEYTCEWLDRPLVDFVRSKENILTITGESGSGKSVLFGWILERLQRPIGRKTYQAVHAEVDGQIPAQATQIALVKTLLLQLLEQNVGNVALYRCLANVLELDNNTNMTQDAEDALWYTLETALKPLKDVALVIDGLEALEGDEEFEAFERLHDIAAKNENVRVIILTRPLPKPFSRPSRHITMGPERTKEDVKHVTRGWLQSCGIGNKHEIEEVADQLAQRSNGSLSWAEMALQLFNNARSIVDVQNIVKELPTTQKELLDKHISTLSLKGDARLIFGWLLTADRPLTTNEIQLLLELNIQKGFHQPRSGNVVEDIQKACGSLIIIQDKTVRFRNESIRLHLLQLTKENQYLMPLDEANKDLTTRLLLYVKTSVSRNVEPSIQELRPYEVEDLFRTNSLLEYASRNWLTHFTRSTFFVGGKLQPLTPEVKNIFPSSTLLVQLERSTWEKQTLMSKANEQQLLAYNIRQQALGDNHVCTMQNSINLALSYKKLNAPAQANKFFYQAAKTAQSVLGKSHELSLNCAVAAIESTEDVKHTARNDEVARKEELLKYVIETDKQRNGANSTLATKYNNELAQLYTDIKENDKAEAVYREVYQHTVTQSGKFSADTLTAAEKLKAVLYKTSKHEEVVQYTQPLFETAEQTLDIFDIRRVEITLQMAKTYEEKGDLVRAEELYISLWRGLTQYCRANRDSQESHERKIQVSIAYARYLKRQNRESEAENILRGVWLEYQHRDNKSKAVVTQLNQVGEELKAMGILETAIAVFKNVWGFLKASGEKSSTAAVGTAVSLADAVQQKQNNKKEAARQAAAAGPAATDAADISDDEGDDEADAIMDEVVEAAIAAPQAAALVVDGAAKAGVVAQAEVTIESRLQTCETLSTFYINKKRWSEAIDVVFKTLRQIWPTIGVEGKYGFPKEYTDESIKLARRLALCYAECNQTEQAEKIYVQVFQSARSSLRIQDELVAESANDLIEFHIRTKQYNKALFIYQQLLESYRTTLGARNPLTLKTLYTMGDLCMKYRLKGADRYYLEITKAEKDNSGVLSQEGLRAAIALSKIYYEQKRWQEARTVYSTVWVTFQKKAKEYQMSPELVQAIHKRYTTVLETYLRVDTTTISQVAQQYRDTCRTVYGPNAQITTTANLKLAEVWRKSDKPEQQQEAVKICEEVVAKSAELPKDQKPTPAQLSILATAKSHLAALYSSQTATGAPTAESTERAERLWREQLETSKKEHGVAHKSTLASLASLVSVWAKSEKPEVRAQAQQQLQTTAVEIISAGNKVDSTKLHESGTSLAKTYLSCNFSAQAWTLLKDLRFQIISKDAAAAAKVQVKIPQAVDRRALVFVAAFEEALLAADVADVTKRPTFSDIMTDLVTEGILYDRYHLSLQAKDVSVEAKIFNGARLYTFLKADQRHSEQTLALEEKLFALFMEQFGANIKTQSQVTRTFFIALVEELSKLRTHDDLALVAISAGTGRVNALLEAEQFAQAYEIALVTYQFTSSRQGFKNPKNIPSSFKLSLYLAGLGVKKTSDFKLQSKMIELSKAVLRETLTACKSLDIDLVQLQATELNNLVRLMGEQKNYEDLEWLLTQLWNSRQLQASWSATTVISVGRRLVEVLYVRNKQDAAIALCESMCYNLRRTWGLLDTVTIELCNLLSSLYVSAGQHADALALHEEILRAELDDDSEDAIAEDVAGQVALQQLELIKRIYARQGGWGNDGDGDIYGIGDLVARTVDEFADEHPGVANFDARVDKWSTSPPSASDPFGTFVTPAEWQFADVQQKKRPDYLLRWLQLNRQQSFGDLAEAKTNGVNGHAAVNGVNGVNGQVAVNGH